VLTAPLGVAVAHAMPAAPLKKIFGVYLVIIAFVMFRNAIRM